MNKQPDKFGYFGEFGGRFVAETLMPAVLEVENAFKQARKDPAFNSELDNLLHTYVGRPSPLYLAARLTEHAKGASVFLKREDLNHTGAHKINNTIGQALLARQMGKRKLMAETGAGQHGVATATAAALFGMECDVYMGEEDIKRQAPNVKRMRLLGARVIPVSSGTRTLKDAMSEALRAWASEVRTTFYVIGSVAGPHPYPVMVRDFQSVIGRETRKQITRATGRLPDCIIACVGGGSNAIGCFYEFIEKSQVRLIGVEAGGKGLDSKCHAATLTKGKEAVIHGMNTICLVEENGDISPVYSISAGLDYPGVGPEHALLHENGRVAYQSATDEEAVSAFEMLSKVEGIIPAIESAHALAAAIKLAPALDKSQIIVVNLSGRGDKDVQQIAEYRGGKLLIKD